MSPDEPGGRDAPAPPYHPAAVEVASGGEQVIPLVEERAHIGKRTVETGRVRVGTRTETHEQVLHESLRGEAVSVTRVPIGRTLASDEAPPGVREEDGVTIVPVLEEILVVEKRLVLKEEVHIRRSRTDEDVEVPVTLRRQRAVIEHVSPDGHVTQPDHPRTLQETKP